MPRSKTIRLQQHAIEFDDCTRIDYRIRWSGRRSLILQIDRRGVHVFAPQHTSLTQIEYFVHLRRDWLRQQHARWHTRAAHQPIIAEPTFTCGESFAWLGGKGVIRRDTPFSRPQWTSSAGAGVQAHIPPQLNHSEAKKAFQHLFEHHALAHFRQRVMLFCEQLDLMPPAVRLSRARTRWGSCSRRSGIRINLRLIALDELLIDYVVAHEVTHLLEMNHSPRFWRQLEAIFPRCNEARVNLRQFSCNP